ncbi:hypothetical protein CI088_06110 [Enterococcus plantarum]|uniref:Cell wall protein n=1 Tax=Enterococcus plantarum TaxID=1077675 RepID=A0A2W3ZET8_9ENTE|nr:SpaA isopeptide-forming pilin-related protein [Enterococcus plantarum]PZL74997.1 hypothetical protein CI088_06110 [Enterococcus plantarum]
MKKKIIKVLILLLVLVQAIDVIGMFRYIAVAYAEETVASSVKEEVIENDEKLEEIDTSTNRKEEIKETEISEKQIFDIPEQETIASEESQRLADNGIEEEVATVIENEEILRDQTYELVTDVYPNLNNADGTPKLDYQAGEEIALYSKLVISSGTFPSNQVKFRIALSKQHFAYFGVVSDGLTFPVTSELSGDSENIYLDITIDNVRTGMDIAIPFRVKFLSDRLYYGTKVPLTQTLYGQNGEVLKENSLDLEARTSNRKIVFGKEYFNQNNRQVPNEFVEDDDLISSDFIDEVPFQVVGDSANDAGDSLVEIKLTKNVIFKAEDNNVAWAYDESSHSISRMLRSSINISSTFKVRYQDVYTNTLDYPVRFTGSVNVLNINGEIETNLEKASAIEERKFFSRQVGDTGVKFMDWKDQNAKYYVEENQDKEISGGIRAKYNEEKGKMFLSKIEDVPTKVAEVSPFTLTEIWLSKKGNPTNTDKNKVYGITETGESTLIAEDLGSTAFSLKDPKPFVSFYIEFDNTVELNDLTDEVVLNFSAKRSSEYWEYLSENLSEMSHSAYNVGNVYYTDQNGDKGKDTSTSSVSTEKAVNDIIFLDKPNKSMVFFGEKFEMTFWHSIQNTTNPKLINPKLHIMLPRGIELIEFTHDATSVMYTEKKNFMNSGKTAIVIEPKTEWRLADFAKVFASHRSKLHLQFNNSASYGSHFIESYLTYENNGENGITMTQAGNQEAYKLSNVDPYQLLSDATERNEMFVYSKPISLIAPSSVFVDVAAKVNEQQGFVHGKTDFVDQGERFNQKISIINYSNNDVSTVTGINVLPHVGDLSTVVDKDGKYVPRGSDLGGLLDGEVEGPEGYTVYYSYDKPSHLMAENQQKGWIQQGEKIDYNKVTMIKIELTNGVLEKNQESEFTFPVKVPIDKAIKHEDKMVNTFTITTNDTNWIESRGSEIPVTAYSVKGSVYRDKNKNSQKESDEPFLVGYEVELEQEGATEPIAKQWTNSQGEYDFSPVPSRGDYTIRIKTKEGDIISEYSQSSEERIATDVTLDPTNNKDGIATVTLAPDTVSHTINMGVDSDLPILGTIELTKLDSVTKQALAGAKFRFEQADGGIIEKSMTTDAGGKIRLKNVPLGNYKFVETEAPLGYELDSTPINIELTDATIVKVTKENTPILVPIVILGSVELTKIDSMTKQALSGATFRLEKTDGTVVQSDLRTNEEGKLLVTNLPLDGYQFIETTAPIGYELDVEPVYFDITEASKTVQVTKENARKGEKIIEPSTIQQTGRGMTNRNGMLPVTGEQKLTYFIYVGYTVIFLLLLRMFSKQMYRRYRNDMLND